MLDFGRFLDFSREHNFKDEARRKLTFADHYRPHQGIGNLQAALEEPQLFGLYDTI